MRNNDKARAGHAGHHLLRLRRRRQHISVPDQHQRRAGNGSKAGTRYPPGP